MTATTTNIIFPILIRFLRLFALFPRRSPSYARSFFSSALLSYWAQLSVSLILMISNFTGLLSPFSIQVNSITVPSTVYAAIQGL